MVQVNVVINVNQRDVWNVIENEFKRSFQVKNNQLLHAKTTYQAANFLGKPITTEQEITAYTKNEYITFVTFSDRDTVTKTYRVESIDSNQTKIVLTEKGHSVYSKLRSANFVLMSFPLLNYGSKKRLKRQLNGLKQLIESKKEVRI